MRHGYFAELQHQTKLEQWQHAQAQQESQQAYQTALSRAEEARRAAANQYAYRDSKAYVAAMKAEVEQRNLSLVEQNEELSSLLSATLNVDDYIDLERLRVLPYHPAFDRPDLEVPLEPPFLIPDPPQPVYVPPPPPKGLKSVFGGGKHAKAVAHAQAVHEQAIAAWNHEVAQCSAFRAERVEAHAQHEAQRLHALNAERARYADECAARNAQAVEHNAAVDELIAHLGYGTVDAIQEYVAIVLSNSVYPAHFPVQHRFEFDASTAELLLKVLVPRPDSLSPVKAYKYTKASDEITSTDLPQKVLKERYASAVHQVALRSLHEIFEADRRGLIKTITLEVGTETIDPATGLPTYVPFVATAAERDSFLSFDLSCVVPSATLAHLGAAVSKNPFGLVPADTTGIRQA